MTSLSTTTAWACACGCSVFDVGFGGLPQENDHGGRVFTELWYANQNKLQAGASKISPDLNGDKKIETAWTTLGVEYMFNREWGAMLRLPYVNRSFHTTADDGSLVKYDSRDLGDVELMGLYTGFSKDMSTGIMFGVKLPTGNYTAPGFDRDTQIGSGSTDLILGGFHRGLLTGDNSWQYFTQVRGVLPVAYRSTTALDGTVATYRPGAQIDGVAGIVYNNGYRLLGFDKIAPVLQLIGSHRERDRGTAADPFNTGYDRLLIAPGIEFTYVLDEANKRVMKVYADVEIPVYQYVNAGVNVNGDQGQLVAPALFKLVASYNF